MRAVDANVLVRLITRDDSKQVVAAVEEGHAWVAHAACPLESCSLSLSGS